MTASSIVMTACGVALTFMPDEISVFIGLSAGPGISTIVLQLTGALYFAFGMINWTAKANLIGGIYGRPIAIGNLSHFVTGGLALRKASLANGSVVVVALAVIYGIFAVCFAIVFFRNPVQATT